MVAGRVGLMRRTPLHRKTRLKRVNRERLARRREKEFGPQSELCRRSPCCVRACVGPMVVPHHWISRAAGGTDSACVPLCWYHHRLVHEQGVILFQEWFGVDFAAVAASMAAKVREGEDG